jgi:aminopeptidase YwaD
LNKYANLFLDELSGKIAKDHAVEISKFHRIQASPGFLDAAVHVQDEIRKAGIEKVSIEKFPADGKTKYWTYDAIISWWAENGEIRMVEPEEELLGRLDELPVSLATHSKSCDVTAEVVDVGVGDRDEDYQGKDLDGKIAIVSGMARITHVKAVDHGALGTIHHPPWNRAAEYPDLVQYNGIWPNQETRDKTTFGFAISDRQYQKIRGLLEGGKKVVVSCKTDGRLYDGFMDVLNAEITGTERPEEEIVLIAHLCHPKTCTNDNGSGSAVLIEVARSIVSLVRSGKIQPPRRTIRFLWVPEINGTVAWMHGHRDRLKDILVSINLDMVGEHPVTVGWPLHFVSAPDSTPSYINPLFIKLLEEVKDDPRGVAIEGWKYGLNYRIKPYMGGSDHLCFADAAFGIPSVVFYNPDQFHHTSFDEPSRLDSSKMKRVGVVTGAAALAVANADERTALELASLTAAHGCRRIAETGSRIASKLINSGVSEGDPSVKLGKIFLRGVDMLDASYGREIEALNSVESLSGSVSGELEEMKKAVEAAAASEKRKLESVYRRTLKDAGGKVIEKKQDVGWAATKNVIPKRTFEGPARGVRPYQVADEGDREWLEGFGRRVPMGGPALELLNLADGRRSVYDITMALSAEFVDVEPSDAKRFYNICESMGKITYL